MLEAKDPAIKLFGKTIPRPESPPAAGRDSNGAGDSQDRDEGPSSCEKQIDNKQDDVSHTFTSLECTDPNETALTDDNQITPAEDNETPASKTTKTEEQSQTNNSEDKTLKKPDKILPCPRCNSMDTKFCYYNNYNVSQPRHFCKKCQRYWTAGGTMRNVPIGAGRRKNKNSASQYRHIISESVYNAQVNIPNGSHYPTIRPNGTVLTFGSDTPLCESMASVFIADKMNHNCVSNGVHKPDNLKILDPHRRGENSDDQTTSVAVSNVKSENGKNGHTGVMMQSSHSYPPQVPVFGGPPWPYPAQWVPPPGVFPPGYPMPFYPPPPYWGPWLAPWLTPPPSTSPNSPTLGKHGRDENSSKQNDIGEGEEKRETSTERSFWIPKTLRIDDPGEAAKSSIWATLGIKHDLASGGGKGGLFKAFQSKADGKSDNSDTSPMLHANPAALSRSQNFQEGS